MSMFEMIYLFLLVVQTAIEIAMLFKR